jgi:hypothetical protein
MSEIIAWLNCIPANIKGVILLILAIAAAIVVARIVYQIIKRLIWYAFCAGVAMAFVYIIGNSSSIIHFIQKTITQLL